MALHFPKSRLLYANNAFALFSDRVENGDYQAIAVKDQLRSNYFTETRLIRFKFSLGGRDNEMGFGEDHACIIRPEDGVALLPIAEFGQSLHIENTNPEAHLALEPNVRVVFRLDLREVKAAIERDGGFQTRTGDWVHEQDLEQVYVRGNKLPLNWNFQSEGPDSTFRLIDKNNDGIFTTELTFHEVAFHAGMRLFNLPETPHPFQFSCGLPLPDLLHRLAQEELTRNERADNCWNTGAQWDGVWTRDAAYAIILGLGIHDPERSMASLRSKVKAGKIIQDTGTGGSWPVSTDRVVWAWAAWETYLASGDEDWLEEAYRVIVNTLEQDRKTLVRPDGLYAGESSFMDWREQSYPAWMQPADIMDSASLSTNILFAQAWKIRAEMALILEKDDPEAAAHAARLKGNIRHAFYLTGTGRWGQFVYPFPGKEVSPRPESLGLALGMLAGVFSAQEAAYELLHTPVTDYGIPCFSPFIPDQPAYHNRGIWPFVQAFWNWSTASKGTEASVLQGLAFLWRSAALFLTNKENLRADNGMDRPTEVNSDRQLWSVAGMLAMPLRVFLGIRLEPEGVYLQPAVPEALAGSITGKFMLRGRTFTYAIKGHGNHIRTLELNGQTVGLPLPYSGSSENLLEIALDNEPFGDTLPPVLAHAEGLATPVAWREGEWLVWQAVKDVRTYRIYRDGQPWRELMDIRVQVDADADIHHFQVLALGSWGRYSFLSKPVEWANEGQVIMVPVPENRAWIKENNPSPMNIEFSVPDSGDWILDLEYANGAGSISDGNACAVRSVLIDGSRKGIVAFPHRKAFDWDNRGFSSTLKLTLESGTHSLSLVLDPLSENMNRAINRARVFSVRLRPVFA